MKAKCKKEDHSFYCYGKQCRKTAYDTPEFMVMHDWYMLGKVIEILKNGSPSQLFNLFWRDEKRYTKDFFNRVIGWPEGYVYCQEESYVEKTAFHGLKKHNLPKLEKARQEYLKSLKLFP